MRSGRLDDWSVRDSAQTALDQQFDETLQLHQTDPAWVAAQSFFNPEQAESYQVTGVAADLRQAPRTRHARESGELRARPALAADRAFRPALAFVCRSGVSAEFGAANARAVTNLPSAIAGSRGGALLVNAVVQEETSAVREPLVGRSATFHMADGSTIVADVLRETSDGYVVKVDPRREQIITRSAVAQIAASGPPRLAELHRHAAALEGRLRALPRSPRALLGRNRRDSSGHRVPRADPGWDANGARHRRQPTTTRDFPQNWIHNSDFPGLDATLDLDGMPISVNSDTGWREAVFDLREIAFEHLGYIAVRPVDVTVTLSMDAGPLGTETAYAFGLGDVVFTGQRREKLRPPAQEILAIDRAPLRPASAAPLAGTPDLWTLRYPDVRLSPGPHTVSTQLRAPWSVVSSSLLGPRPAPHAAAAAA